MSKAKYGLYSGEPAYFAALGVRPIKELSSDSRAHGVDFRARGFEGLFEKPTLLAGTLIGMGSLARRCLGNRARTAVTGTFRVWDPTVKAHRWKQASQHAGIYVVTFCYDVARLAVAEARRRYVHPVPQKASLRHVDTSASLQQPAAPSLRRRRGASP